jgi:CHAT domain-containing protein/Tfp pilus assembly protein PilF
MKLSEELKNKAAFSVALLSFILSPAIPCDAQSTPRPSLRQTPETLFQEGEVLRNSGDYEQSIAAYTRSLHLSLQEKNREIELETLIGLGLAHWNAGSLIESTDSYKKAFILAKKLCKTEIENYCALRLDIYQYYQQGKESRSAGRYQEAIESFNKAILISRETRSLDHEVKCLRQLSVTYWEQGNLKDFHTLSSKALTISIAIKNRKEEGRCLNNLGLYYWRIDNYSSALSAYEKSLSIAQKQNNVVDQADSLHNIGIIWTYLGNFEKAIDYLNSAYQLDQTLTSKTNLASDLNTIGMALIKKGALFDSQNEYVRALEYFNNSLSLAQEAKDKKRVIIILNNIGSAKSHLKSYSEALEYFNIALKQADEIDDRNSLGMIYNNIGIVYANIGNFEESTRFYEKAINLALGIKGGDILWEAYLEKANSLRSQKRSEDAIANYSNSIRVIEEIRSNLAQEELKATYLGSGKRMDAYQNIIDLLSTIGIEQSDKTYEIRAFNYLEKAKARAFLDSLEVSEVNVSQGVDIKLANQEKEIMREISQLYTKLLLPSLGSEEKTSISILIRGFEEKQDALKREIRTTSPAYANLKYPEVITYDEARNSLVDKSTTFFAYSLGKDRSFVFALSGGGLKVFVAPARKTLQQQVAEYRKVISDKDNQDFSLGHVLFKELVLPGLDKSTKKIVFVPDDILNLLPFETLVSEAGTTRWLVQDHPVSYVPSLSSLRELNRRRSASRIRPHKDLLAFGDPFYGANEENRQNASTDIFQDFYSNSSINFFRLKFSGLEIQKIAAAFKPSRTDVFRRQEATEDRLKAEPLTNYRIIHFATHGLIDDKKPARSSIILALDQDPGEDGFLQMREVFNLRMNADLVTLSACQTGLGQFIRGEGIEGLSRAFFYAGASSVLMSLWAVNDEATYQLMERFYGYLRESETPMNALRRAKLEMIGSGVLSHPYYWAGFIVNGKSDTVIFPGTVKRWVLLASSLCAGIMILVALRNLNRRRT